MALTQPDHKAAFPADVFSLLGRPATHASKTYFSHLAGSYDLKNRYWALLSGVAAPLAGSAVAVIFWSVLIFRLAMTLLGRGPAAMTSAARTMAITMAAFGLVRIATTLGNSGLAGWEDCVPLLIYLAPLWVFPFALQSDGRILVHLFIIGSALGTVLAAFVVMGQIMSGMARAEGFLGNSAVFATILAASGTIGALNMRLGGRHFWLGAASLCAMIVCVIASETRTLWLMIPVNLVFVAIILRKSVSRPMLMAMGAASVAILALTAVLFGSTVERRVTQAVSDISAIEDSSNFDTSLGLRYIMWGAAAKAIVERPLFGYGMTEAMDPVHQVMVDNNLRRHGFTHPHNAFLFSLLNAGVFGLVTLLAMLALPLILAWRSKAEPVVKMFVTVLIANYFVAGLPGLIFHHDILDAFFVTCVMIAVCALPNSPANGPLTP